VTIAVPAAAPAASASVVVLDVDAAVK